jgi:uncharacterized protein (DUF433 family)
MIFAAIIVRVQRTLAERGGDCSMEEILTLCPELTWNQVFLAVDYLSRTGQIRVTLDSNRTYRVQAVPTDVSSTADAPV